MFTDGVKATMIDGRELDLVLNTEAMAQLCDEFGDIDGVGEALNDAKYSEKVRIIPRLVALLATQGEAIKGSSEVITPEYVLRQTLPKDIPQLTKLFLRAVEIGMNIKITATEDTDEVLAEIQKNAQGAAGTI